MHEHLGNAPQITVRHASGRQVDHVDRRRLQSLGQQTPIRLPVPIAKEELVVAEVQLPEIPGGCEWATKGLEATALD